MATLSGTFQTLHDYLVWSGKLQGNANALSRIDTRPCAYEHCPDHGHLIKKVTAPSQKKPGPLCAIQARCQDDGHDLKIISDVVPSLSDDDIRVA